MYDFLHKIPKAFENRMLTVRNIRISWRDFWELMYQGIDMMAYDEE